MEFYLFTAPCRLLDSKLRVFLVDALSSRADMKFCHMMINIVMAEDIFNTAIKMHNIRSACLYQHITSSTPDIRVGAEPLCVRTITCLLHFEKNVDFTHPHANTYRQTHLVHYGGNREINRR